MSDNNIFSYEYSDGDGPHSDSGMSHIVVPDGVDFDSYIRGRQDEAASTGYKLWGFEPAPEMQRFRVRHTMWLGDRELITDAFSTSCSDCTAEWAAMVADQDHPVTSFEVIG